jgi:AcrR family transcriptional regulator
LKTVQRLPAKDSSFTRRLPVSKIRRDRTGKQKALISAATSLFSRHGYEATTTREIAAYAKCSEGLIHRYFGGKSGLLFQIVNLRFAEERISLDEIPMGATWEDEIRQLMDQQLEYLWEDREFLRVMLSSAILQPQLSRVLGDYGAAGASMIARHLSRHKECPLTDEKDIEGLAHALMAMSFNFGFIRAAILGQNRTQTKNLAIRAAKLLSRAVPTQ